MGTYYILGAFRLDSAANTLFRGGEPVALGRRAVAVLRALVEQPGTLISKGTLIGAAWHGLLVEESNLAVQISALRKVFAGEPGGERWIETLPGRGYRFVGPTKIEKLDPVTVALTLPQSAIGPDLSLPEKPSIAVLAFQNMSGDPEQEYFADGLVEDITTALSWFKALIVVARNSSFVFKGKAVDIQQVARELDVRYVLEGSVRKAGGRIRITGQLIDASTRAHLWAEKFDASTEDVFELQDQITARVVGSLVPSLQDAELKRARRKPPSSLDAYDCVLRALPHIIANTPGAPAEAIRLLEAALSFDPDYAYAHALLAMAMGQVFRDTVGPAREAAGEFAEKHARRALALGGDDSTVLAYAGWVLLIAAADVDGGRTALAKATQLNPNLSSALAYHSIALAITGEPKAAIEDAIRALRLSPVDPNRYLALGGIAIARVVLGEYDEAADAASEVIKANPHFPMGYAWSIVAECGRQDDAQVRLRLRQLGNILPGFTSKDLPNLFSFFPLEIRNLALRLVASSAL